MLIYSKISFTRHVDRVRVPKSIAEESSGGIFLLSTQKKELCFLNDITMYFFYLAVLLVGFGFICTFATHLP